MLLRATLDDVRLAAQPLTDGEAGDYDALLKLIGDARVVLLGVSSEGTHEFFRARAELTTRLIKDKGFTAVALSADAAAIDRLDNFVRGHTADELASNALGDFVQFPTWLWRNAEMLDFLGWLRNFNDQFSGDAHKARVCGVDLESGARTVVWEHSREVGDARATDQGGTSLGQLARERYGRLAVLVNFSTYAGTFIAASGDGAAPRRYVLPAVPRDSVEAVCHAVEIPRFYLPLRGAPERLAEFLREPRLERFLGSVYQADSPQGNSIRTRLVDQFDALVHFDETRSLEPIDPSGGPLGR